MSNPCIELWLLLHGKEQQAALTSSSVLSELKKSAPVWANYSKSSFTETQKAFLKENMGLAIQRSKQLKDFQNPSSEIYKLIEIL